MTALVSSELLKVRTTRSWWGYLVVIALLSGIAAAGTIGSAVAAERGTVEFQRGLAETVGVASLLAIILGITIVTLEFRHGTVTPTFLAAPRRERVLAAKAIAGIVVALAFAVLALVVVAGVTLVWFGVIGVDARLGSGEVWRTIGEQFLAAVLWVLLGVAIGTAVHGQVAALVGTLVWIFLGESLLGALFGVLDVDGVTAYLPFRALDAADGTGGEGLLSYGAGLLVSLAWIAGLGAFGTVRTRRRDIS